MAVLGVGAGTTVTAQMDADFYAGILGDKKMVLPIGRQMESELIDNNTVRIHDGVAIIQGRYICVEANTYDEFKLENGTQGVNRYDIIGYRLYRADGKEFCENVVTKDVGVSGTVETEVFRDGGQEVFIPIYRVCLEGLNITGIEPLFEVLYTSEHVKAYLDGLLRRTDLLNEYIQTMGNTQMKEYDDHLKLTGSEYFEIKDQRTMVNIRTGEVNIYLKGLSLQVIPAGKNVLLANLQRINLIPEDDMAIPAIASSTISNIGSMKAALFPAGHSSYQGQIRGTVLNQINKNNLIYLHVQYFVDPETAREGLDQIPALPLIGTLKPAT